MEQSKKNKRILLKISGEAFSGENAFWIHQDAATQIAHLIQQISQKGIELAIVVWGWNIYRGSSLIASGVIPADSHNMSMLSTVFNAVALKNFLHKIGVKSIIMDALGVEFLERYTSIAAERYISEWKIVICTSGTGAPFFSTDTGWVIRALELQCDMLIKATKVDGVYNKDPMKYWDAQKIETLSYDDFIAQNLKVFDQTGIILARDGNLPIFVTLFDIEHISDILDQEKGGTKIS